MDREALKRELAELEAKNAAATSWGAAVGARHERIKGIRAALSASHAQDANGCVKIDDLIPLFRDAASVNMTEEAVERQARRFAEAITSLYNVRPK